MAVLDAKLGRARLDPEELAAASLLLSRPGDPVLGRPGAGAALQRLKAAGGLQDDSIVPWLARLLGPVAAPELRVLTELHQQDAHAIVAIAWCREQEAVLGRLAADDETELAAVEPATLPAAIGAEVGLVPRPEPPEREPLTASSDELAAAYAEPGEDPLGRLMAARQRSWRVTATDRDETRSLGVLDAGEQGLWLSEPAEDGITLRPTSAEQIVNALLSLFGDQVLHLLG